MPLLNGNSNVELSSKSTSTGDSSTDSALADSELIGALGANFSSVGEVLD